MSHFEDATNEYSTFHSSKESEVLERLRGQPGIGRKKPKLLSAPMRGGLLAMVIGIQKPRKNREKRVNN